LKRLRPPQSAFFLSLILGLFPVANGSVIVISNHADPQSIIDLQQYAGLAITVGSTDSYLNSVTFDYDAVAYTPGAPNLEVETRNGDGTVGATLYTIAGPSNFTVGGGQITMTAPTNFTLAAGNGYWLVFSDTTLGIFGRTALVATASTSYTSASGFSIPSTRSMFGALSDNPTGGQVTFYNIGSNIEKFSVTASPAPEPASLVLMGLGGIALLHRRRRKSTRKSAMPSF
jgi:hypothetical protein